MTPPWEGTRVRLRAVEPADLDLFVAADDDGEGLRSGWRVFPPRSAWASHEWVRRETEATAEGDEFHAVIEALDGGEVVGTLNTLGCDPVDGTFGYGVIVWPWHRRRGYARDAIIIVLRYLFGERRYQKCTVGVLASNDASLALHRSLGFREEGRIRRAHFRGGLHEDEVLFGITVDEYAERWPLT